MHMIVRAGTLGLLNAELWTPKDVLRHADTMDDGTVLLVGADSTVVLTSDEIDSMIGDLLGQIGKKIIDARKR